MEKTLMENYGVTAALKSKVIQAKSRQTMLLRYGVEHSMQHREFFEKQQRSGFKIRKVKVDGKVFLLRGYEPEALKFIVTLGCKGSDIYSTVKEGVPSIQYEIAGINHIYHPDFYAKIKNKWYVIEVKSTYTSGLRSDKNGMFSRLKIKANATIENGYRFALIVVGVDGQCKVIRKVQEKKRSQVISELQGLR